MGECGADAEAGDESSRAGSWMQAVWQDNHAAACVIAARKQPLTKVRSFIVMTSKKCFLETVHGSGNWTDVLPLTGFA